jgi:hypothetical protein
MRYEDIPTTAPWPDYVALIREVGGGFHPDESSDGYAPMLPDGLRIRYDRVIREAREAEGVDLYEVGLAVFDHDWPELRRRVA